jgi:GT2 family glycosyltransferase
VIGVIVATRGRPELINRLVHELEKQTRLPDQLVLSICSPSDLPVELCAGEINSPIPVAVVQGTPGSSVQRNRGIAYLHDNTSIMTSKSGIVIFLDDDFIMQANWIELVEREMENNPQVAGYTGLVLADGAPLEGYTADAAVAIMDNGRPLLPASDWRMRPGGTESLYGCNMAVRCSVLGDLRFDEKLILSGWLEDFDFSVRLAGRGLLQRSPLLVGVHLGWKAGRSSGVSTGYAQVANPVYLYRKRTMTLRVAAKYVSKNFCANLLKLFRPERLMDRRGRLKGNMLALRDLLANRIAPHRISTL